MLSASYSTESEIASVGNLGPNIGREKSLEYFKHKMGHTVLWPSFIPLGGLKYLRLRISLKRLQIQESHKGKSKYSLNYNSLLFQASKKFPQKYEFTKIMKRKSKRHIMNDSQHYQTLKDGSYGNCETQTINWKYLKMFLEITTLKLWAKNKSHKDKN